ncbi:MAG: hypothetical protein DDT31_01918 [Syntrophomonadaceae bacterium]|nr:hypothetical protein [Bacillota bacterium]
MATTIQYMRGDTRNIVIHVPDPITRLPRNLLAVTRARLSVARSERDWAASTAYVVGNIIKPVIDNGRHYVCIVAGISGAIEPVWTTDLESVIVSGTTSWRCIAIYQFQIDTTTHGADGNAIFTLSAEATGIVVAPAAAITVDSGIAGNLNGAYHYRIAFVCGGGRGETSLGVASILLNVVNRRVDISSIPVGRSGVVVARKIYRTAAGGNIHRLVATIQDNTTTTHQDNVADVSLGAVGLTENKTTMKDGDYDYDCELQWSGGSTINTVVKSTFTVLADITRN